MATILQLYDYRLADVDIHARYEDFESEDLENAHLFVNDPAKRVCLFSTGYIFYSDSCGDSISFIPHEDVGRVVVRSEYYFGKEVIGSKTFHLWLPYKDANHAEAMYCDFFNNNEMPRIAEAIHYNGVYSRRLYPPTEYSAADIRKFKKIDKAISRKGLKNSMSLPEINAFCNSL